MTTADTRLERIAAITGDDRQVRIVTLDRGYTIVQWLCPNHVELAEQQGWDVKQSEKPPHELLCDWRSGKGACS